MALTSAFRLEERVPAGHLVGRIDAVLDPNFMRERMAPRDSTNAEIEARTGAGKAREPRCGRSSATETTTAIGTPVPGGSRWKSRSSGRGAAPSFLNHAAQPRRPWWR